MLMDAEKFNREAPVAVNKDKVILRQLVRKVQDPVKRAAIEANLQHYQQSQAAVDAELDTISKTKDKTKGPALEQMLERKKTLEEQRAECIKHIKRLRDELDWEPPPRDHETKFLNQTGAGVYGSWDAYDMLEALHNQSVVVVHYANSHCEVWAP